MSTAVAAKESRTGLAELRAIKQGAIETALPRVRALLAELKHPLDIEAAGALLSGRTVRETLGNSKGFRAQRIALLGSSTLDMVPNLLTALLVRDSIAPTIRVTGFNQWRFEVLAGGGMLADFKPQLVACLLDDEAVFSDVANPLDIREVEERCGSFAAELGDWIDKCRDICGGRVILSTILLSPLRTLRLIDYRRKAGLAAAWTRMNADILTLADTKPETIVLAADTIATRSSAVFPDDRMRHVAAHAYAPEFLCAYATELAAIARADLGLAKKCLVLDLDNTLWGGVVGDVGTSGLTLGRAYPGSAHRELQSLARDLTAQGVLLTVCSKNEDTIAREALEQHPEMVLRAEDFALITANWQPKAENIQSQAKTLNIGLDAMVFVDDHPVERDAVRTFLPQVTTPEMPADIASYALTLAAQGYFNLLELTEEDRARGSIYQAQSGRAEYQAQSLSLESYLMGLASELRIEPRNGMNASRIAQLFAKTNQFNLTGRRFSADEVRGSGLRFFAARLADRFGDNGLIAALAVGTDPDGTWTIENFVLSCRVFSRRVEDALVSLVLAAAKDCAAPAVIGRFVETAKNGQFADFYNKLGFTNTGEHFRHGLDGIPALPVWIRITQGTEVFHVV
jgi:FkbH-like protein